MCSLYLGENLISGSKPINLGVRNIGEIVYSSLPLTDAGLHLLDGSRLSGDGIYKGFVDYIADLYNDTKVYNPSAFTVVGNPTITDDGIASGFSSSNYIKCQVQYPTKPFNIRFKFKCPTNNAVVCQFGSAYARNTFLKTSNHGFNWWIWNNNSEDLRMYVQVNSFVINGEYEVYAGWDGQVYFLKIYKDGTLLDSTTQSSSVQPLLSSDNSFYIANGNEFREFTDGSIDLKQFSITVDGKEVFSGSKPAKYFTDETTWQTSVTTYGSCGKFVYDSTNNTVRLPKVSDILQGTTDINALGNLVKAGLPVPSHTHTRGNMNITGRVYSGDIGLGPTGAFYTSENSNGPTGNYQNRPVIYFDASRNWTGSTSQPNGLPSVYGNSSTVQPQTIKAFVYIVIANSTKTEIQSDIDEIATDLNGKADTDLTNVTNSAKVMMSGMGMPSDKYINLTLGASGTTYTAPANGYFAWRGNMTSNGNHFAIVRNEPNAEYGLSSMIRSPNTSQVAIYLLVRKGDVVYITYDGIDTSASSSRYFRFYYAQGSESEAQ